MFFYLLFASFLGLVIGFIFGVIGTNGTVAKAPERGWIVINDKIYMLKEREED